MLVKESAVLYACIIVIELNLLLINSAVNVLCIISDYYYKSTFIIVLFCSMCDAQHIV